MYVLFVLGQLMDRPMTGYQLRKALTAVVGRDLTISFGALYPLLDKLAAAGDLTLAFTAGETNRPQKVATITPSGQAHFQELVLASVGINKQTQLTYQMKVNFLHLLAPEQRVAVLRDFQAFTAGQLDQLKANRDVVAHNQNMVAGDIQDALRVNQLLQLRAQTQADWLAGLVREIMGELA